MLLLKRELLLVLLAALPALAFLLAAAPSHELGGNLPSIAFFYRTK